jgi:MFS family permease
MASITNYKLTPLIAVPAGIVAMAVLAFWPTGLPTPVILALLAIYGIGAGTTMPVNTVAVQNAVALHQMGQATGLVNFVRALGGSLMVTLVGVILLNGLGLPAGSSLSFEGGDLPGLATGADFVTGFRHVFMAVALASLAGYVFLLRLEMKPLRTKIGHD